MTEWDVFPFWEPRPEGIRKFKRTERAALEAAIALQVSDLLSRHGEIEEVGVDPGNSAGIEDEKTFRIIELEEIRLEDDGELGIGQLPFSKLDASGFLTKPGSHSILKCSDLGKFEQSLTVWDPDVSADRRVQNERGKKIGLPVLQELFEVLYLVGQDFDQEGEGNNPPLKTAEFPLPVIEPELQALAVELGFNQTD